MKCIMVKMQTIQELIVPPDPCSLTKALCSTLGYPSQGGTFRNNGCSAVKGVKLKYAILFASRSYLSIVLEPKHAGVDGCST